jgi:hypothetical protein
MTDKASRPWLRGAVWMAVGVIVWIGSVVLKRPVVVRGTDLPWGAVVIGVGALLLGWDVINARRKS